MTPEVCYFCFCGKVFIMDSWQEQSKKLWDFLNGFIQKDQLEIRICSHLCPECYQNWLDGKQHKHIRLGGFEDGQE